jgi:hypothetical protein
MPEEALEERAQSRMLEAHHTKRRPNLMVVVVVRLLILMLLLPWLWQRL